LTEAEVKEKMMDHDKEGFETRRIKKDGKLQVYTRQIAAEIVLKEGGQPL
jgi:exopolysaccharide biosynthesis protein